MTNSITIKLIGVLTLCVAVIHGGGSYIDYQLSREEVLERVRLESLDTVNNVVHDLEHWLDGVQGSTLLLSRILEQKEFSAPELDRLLRNVVLNEEDIYGAAIALEPGYPGNPPSFAPYYYRNNGILTRLDLARDGKKYWRESWYANAVKDSKPIWIEPYFDAGATETLMTTFSVPIYRSDTDGNRSLYAVITADLELEKLHTYLQKLRLGESGRAMLISRAGIVLSSDRHDFIMQHYLDALGARGDRDTWQRSFNAALRGESLVFPIQCPGRLGQCSTRLTTLASTGWPVAVLYSQSELLAPVRAYGIRATLIGVATLLVMVLMISLVTRRLTKPLTSLAEASDAIARGKLEVPLPRVGGNDEVARLVQSFRAMQGDLKTYIADLEVATTARARLEGEMAAATQIQMSMLPQGGEAREQTTRYDLWAKVRPAKSVGGDLYTYYRHGEGKLFVVVGDVSDKGVPAALFMAKAISHIQQFEAAFESPSRGMALLNNALEQGNDNCMFVTLFFGVINLDTLELQFSSAGHTAPSLLRDQQVTELTQETGPALGLVADISYPENTLTLAVGDRLAIYTDGIDEAFNNKAEMFTAERLNQKLKETGGMGLATAGAAIFQAIEVFAGDAAQSDDITLMLIDLLVSPQEKSVSHHYSCEASAIGSATEWLLKLVQPLPIEHAGAMELLMVAEEILTNIQKYAQLPSAASIEIRVDITSGSIVLEVTDPGMAFNPLLDAHRATLGADIESAEIGGLGVHLITRLTDKQSYQRSANKNTLRVEKYLSPPAPPKGEAP